MIQHYQSECRAKVAAGADVGEALVEMIGNIGREFRVPPPITVWPVEFTIDTAEELARGQRAAEHGRRLRDAYEERVKRDEGRLRAAWERTFWRSDRADTLRRDLLDLLAEVDGVVERDQRTEAARLAALDDVREMEYQDR